jgi:hypothetical protein
MTTTTKSTGGMVCYTPNENENKNKERKRICVFVKIRFETII